MKNLIDGYIGKDLTYCSQCGLESEECVCDAAVVEEELGGSEEEEDAE